VVTLIGSKIWYSTNAGGSWLDISVIGGYTTYSHICVSGDGTKVYLTASHGVLGYGVFRWDGGTTWTEILDTSPTSDIPGTIKCSNDGSVILVESPHGSSDNYLRLSIDSGVSWSSITPPPDSTYMFDLFVSSDGQRFMLGCQGASQAGGIYTSIDQGATWVLEHPRGYLYSKNWFIAANDDFSQLYATTREYRPLWLESQFTFSTGVITMGPVRQTATKYPGRYGR
jgi:photosystem II stability/assembly factor-like uncharacterized protein